MKVKKLIKKLQKMDQDLEVWVAASDGDDLMYYDECGIVEKTDLPDYCEGPDKVVLLY